MQPGADDMVQSSGIRTLITGKRKRRKLAAVSIPAEDNKTTIFCVEKTNETKTGRKNRKSTIGTSLALYSRA